MERYVNKISVVVPIYNVENYLRQCIESLLAQTFTPYEVILVDDGSTDGSGKIADEYAEKYNLIRVIHKDNAGLGYARNTGIEHAKGDWVVFLDSDDYFGKKLLEHLVVAQNKYGAELVIGGYERVDESGKIVGGVKYSEAVYNETEIKKDLIPRLLGSAPDKSDSISMSACNALFSMDIIRRDTIRFPSERVVISEDLFFDFDYYMNSKSIALITETEYKYRVTSGSLTRKYRYNRYDLCKVLYVDMMSRIRSNHLPKECELRLMRSMFNYWRMCFSQEKKSISGKTLKARVDSIRKICEDSVTVEIVNEYPVKKLGTAQRAFLGMVKHRLALTLLFFVENSSLI